MFGAIKLLSHYAYSHSEGANIFIPGKVSKTCTVKTICGGLLRRGLIGPRNVQLRISEQALYATLKILKRAGRRESGLFWYGPRDRAGNGKVALVVAPRQRMAAGNYFISAEALAEVVHGLPENYRPLAQVHSHPGFGVEHSNYDDRMMSSRNALSLVIPSYGHVSKPFPAGVGIHEWQEDYWHLLDPLVAATRVIVTGDEAVIKDLR